MVLDFRALNEKTVGDAYSLPNIVDILDQLGGAQYFSVCDLASKFHQIKMDPTDIKPFLLLGALRIRSHALQIKKCSYYLPKINGSSTIRILRPEIVYIDDKICLYR